MERFENAQVGDLVHCDFFGDGDVTTVYDNTIIVYFLCAHVYEFFKNGYAVLNNAENHKPCLFYRKGEERYLTERPEPEIDWNTVKPGTLCIVKDHEEEPDREREFFCFVDGKIWFKQINNLHANPWNYARIK